MAIQFEAVKVALKQDKTGFILTLSVHPDEIPDELVRDFVGARYGCALVRIQDDETPTVYNNRVKKAGILCKDFSFKQFIGFKTNFQIDTTDQCANTLCHLLSIESRTELNGNKQAQNAFDDLIKEYEEFINNDDF
jgi:hypothetical protein